MVTLSLDITRAIAIKCSIQGDRGKAPEGQSQCFKLIWLFEEVKIA